MKEMSVMEGGEMKGKDLWESKIKEGKQKGNWQER